MNREQAEAILRIGRETWPGEMNEVAQLAWAKVLVDLDFEEVGRALVELAKTMEFRPTIARVVREMRAPGLDESRVAISRLLYVRGSSASDEEIQALGPTARRMVTAMGGWTAVCRLREVDVPGAIDRAALAVSHAATVHRPGLPSSTVAALPERTTP